MHINVGDRVRDTNPTWPNYNCTGVVTSVNGNMITWRHDVNNQLITDTHDDLEKIMKRGGRPIRKLRKGGRTRRKKNCKTLSEKLSKRWV